MTPHGPDAKSFEGASNADEGPAHLPADTLAFMFETCVQRGLMPVLW